MNGMSQVCKCITPFWLNIQKQMQNNQIVEYCTQVLAGFKKRQNRVNLGLFLFVLFFEVRD